MVNHIELSRRDISRNQAEDLLQVCYIKLCRTTNTQENLVMLTKTDFDTMTKTIEEHNQEMKQLLESTQILIADAKAKK